MRVVIVYESIWGNTAMIAQAIARRLESFGEVRLVLVLEAGPGVALGADLLVVGGPTHAHGMSRASSRRSAAGSERVKGAPCGPGVREWLQRLPHGDGTWVATFDTRLDKPRWLVGAASVAISRRLKQRGYRQIVPPESFFVLDKAGPLKAGEIDRADAWAGLLGERVADELVRKRASTPEPLGAAPY